MATVRSGGGIRTGIRSSPHPDTRAHVPFIHFPNPEPALPVLMRISLIVSAAVAAMGACTNRTATPPPEVPVGPPIVASIDSARLLRDVSVLSADSMVGRGTNAAGAVKARRYLVPAFGQAGLQMLGTSFQHAFTYGAQADPIIGVNLLGRITGTELPGRVIVISAHYDHLGSLSGRIYNGADDNASGTAALLEIARHFSRNPPRHTLIFAAFDAEETGLRGARAFVANPPVPRDSIALVVNMDMISRNASGELYAAGTYHTPALEPVLQRVIGVAPVTLKLGHDRPNLPAGDDWTQSSDHGPFHGAGIPFVYFGVEDHPDYHQPTDDFERIDPGFYARATRTILTSVIALDAADLPPRTVR